MSLTWAQAAEFPLATLDTDVHGLSAMTDAFAANDLDPTISVQTDSVASLFALVNTGRWASLIPDRWAISSGSTTELTFVELAEPRISSPMMLTVPRSQPSSPVVRALIAALTSEGQIAD